MCCVLVCTVCVWISPTFYGACQILARPAHTSPPVLAKQVFAGAADLINTLEHCQAILQVRMARDVPLPPLKEPQEPMPFLPAHAHAYGCDKKAQAKMRRPLTAAWRPAPVQGREMFVPATGLLAAATPSTTSTSQPPSPAHASASALPPPNTVNAAAIAAALAAADAAGDFALPASAPPMPVHPVPSPAALRRASSSNGPKAQTPLHNSLSTSQSAQPVLGPGPDRSRRVGGSGAACREADYSGRPAVPAPGPGPEFRAARGSDEHSCSPPLWPRVSGQEGSPRLRTSPAPPPALPPQSYATDSGRVVQLPLTGAAQVHPQGQGFGTPDTVGQAVFAQGMSSIALGRVQQQQEHQQQRQEWQQQARWQREPQERQQQQWLPLGRQERQSMSAVSASGLAQLAGAAVRGSGDGSVLSPQQQGPRTSPVQGERQQLSGIRYPGAAPPLLLQEQQQQQQQLGMELGGPGRQRAPGLGEGTGADGAAGGRGAPQLPLAEGWREQQPVGQVQEGKLLRLLQVRNTSTHPVTQRRLSFV